MERWGKSPPVSRVTGASCKLYPKQHRLGGYGLLGQSPDGWQRDGQQCSPKIDGCRLQNPAYRAAAKSKRKRDAFRVSFFLPFLPPDAAERVQYLPVLRKRAHQVPVADPCQAILRRQPQLGPDGAGVFKPDLMRPPLRRIAEIGGLGRLVKENLRPMLPGDVMAC